MSCKGTRPMGLHFELISKYWNFLCSYYSQRVFRRDRMNLYMKEQKAYSYVSKKLKVHSPLQKRRTIVILGDGHFNTSSAGHDPLPSAKRLYGNLKKRGVTIVYQDEFRTSKLCSKCRSWCIRRSQSTARTSSNSLTITAMSK